MVIRSVNSPFANQIESGLGDGEVNAILEIFNRVGMRDWLQNNPFQKLEIAPRVFLWLGQKRIEVYGVYDYQTNEASIATTRDSADYAQALIWGRTDKLSHTGRTSLEAIQFTALHELGHRIHAILRDSNGVEFGSTQKLPRTNAVSNYAKSVYTEYFAETFVAWVLYRTELFVNDFLGYGMMLRALNALGIEVIAYDFNT